jgi:hypothetical protein
MFFWETVAGSKTLPPTDCACMRSAIAAFNGAGLKYLAVPSNSMECTGGSFFRDCGTCAIKAYCNSNYALHCVIDKCNLMTSLSLLPIDFGLGGDPVGWDHTRVACAKWKSPKCRLTVFANPLPAGSCECLREIPHPDEGTLGGR